MTAGCLEWEVVSAGTSQLSVLTYSNFTENSYRYSECSIRHWITFSIDIVGLFRLAFQIRGNKEAKPIAPRHSMNLSHKRTLYLCTRFFAAQSKCIFSALFFLIKITILVRGLNYLSVESSIVLKSSKIFPLKSSIFRPFLVGSPGHTINTCFQFSSLTSNPFGMASKTASKSVMVSKVLKSSTFYSNIFLTMYHA